MDASQQFATLLLTYLVHSTVLIGLVWLLVRTGRVRLAAVRERLWRGAMFGGVVTSLLAWSLPLPRLTETISIQTNFAATVPQLAAQEVAVESVQPSPDSAHTPRAAAGAIVPRKPAAAAIPASVELSASWCDWLLTLWTLVVGAGAFHLAAQFRQLQVIRRRSQLAKRGSGLELVRRLAGRLGFHRPVEVYFTTDRSAPMAAGILHGRIFLPDKSLLKELDRSQLEGLVAHELSHLARRDPLWNLLSLLVCVLGWLQPLNHLARRRLQVEAEYLADARAAGAVSNPMGLARCLLTFGQWCERNRQTAPVLISPALGPRAFRSLLGRRVELLLQPGRQPGRISQDLCLAGITAALALLLWITPQIQAGSNRLTPLTFGEETMPFPTMKQSLVPLAVAIALTTSPAPESIIAEAAPPAVRAVDEIPAELDGFRGMMTGVLVSKDEAKSTFVFKVEKVTRVWKESRASDPKVAVGKSFLVDIRETRLANQHRETLKSLEPNDPIEVEPFHFQGNTLSVMEALRKID